MKQIINKNKNKIMNNYLCVSVVKEFYMYKIYITAVL